MTYLELGDIIKLHSPTNESLDNKVFIISFINDNFVDLNSSELNITLNIVDNKLTEESITKISILYKNDLKGFVKQNGLNVDKWVDIYFGGNVPSIITAEITDVIEDMIELKIYPSNDIIYIDFSFNGIPKELNIEKIVLRDKSPTAKEEEQQEIDEEMFEDNIEISPLAPIEAKIQDDIIEGSKIVFGESMGELLQEVEVQDEFKRYDIDKQVNDILDEMLSKIPKQDRTYKVINEIHTYIERFKQLREEFSSFDSLGNITEKVTKGYKYKPLKNILETFNKKIPWIIPVVMNKKKNIFTRSRNRN